MIDNSGTFPISTVNAGFWSYFGLFLIFVILFAICISTYLYANWLKYGPKWNRFYTRLQFKLKSFTNKNEGGTKPKKQKMGAVIGDENPQTEISTSINSDAKLTPQQMLAKQQKELVVIKKEQKLAEEKAVKEKEKLAKQQKKEEKKKGKTKE